MIRLSSVAEKLVTEFKRSRDGETNSLESLHLKTGLVCTCKKYHVNLDIER
jgi:hypothetical protein